MGITLYNMLSCSGWEGGQALGDAVGVAPEGCMAGRLGMVGLFFLTAIVRKWGGEEMDIDFSFLWSLVLGIGAYLILIALTGSFKWSFLAGMIGMLIGGYLIGQFTGDGDSY